MSARRTSVALSLVLVLGWVLTGAALARAPRASLTDVENDVMCVTCREPLAVAQSPQAQEERGYIRQLIGQGLDRHQIEQALVAQYGVAVLGKPPATGFNLTVYILPPAILLAGVAVLVLVLPRWRRASRRAGGGAPALAARALDQADARRLAEDLSRFEA